MNFRASTINLLGPQRLGVRIPVAQVCACLITMQVLTSSVLLVKEAFWQGALLFVGAAPFVWLFLDRCDRLYQDKFRHVPLASALFS